MMTKSMPRYHYFDFQSGFLNDMNAYVFHDITYMALLLLHIYCYIAKKNYVSITIHADNVWKKISQTYISCFHIIVISQSQCYSYSKNQNNGNQY